MQTELTTAREAAQAAGNILLNYYQADYEIRDKGFLNPVTSADYASNRYLEECLRDSFPSYGWLSEETADTHDRLSRERVWVVDPLDGTKEFIEGVPQFVVSIALVENSRPVLGVLHNPVSGETFTATEGNGANLNGKPITVSKVERLEDAVILNSRSETKRGLWKPYKPYFRSLKAVGSVAYKLGLAAAGQADMFATLRPKNEWDVCAGHIILKEAGAELRVLNGQEHGYNNKRVVIKPGLVGGNPILTQAFLKLYNSRRSR
ncbi:MAG: 3'(2'),5'-bisphosphate nucleotidase CysQ [Fidelibacterota bacterium]|nr:MAG: 3'(2'),5'-bisphosphate nucleotidase CysQ [Candidatus Neomarinimicrobiota bacterium]